MRKKRTRPPRGYKSWTSQVTGENKPLRFERRPSVRWGRDTRNRTVERNGRIIEAEIVLDSKLKKYPKLMKVVAKHELRENLAFQNYASKRQAHQYALKKESRDLRSVGLSKKKYRSLTRKLGYIP